MPVASIDNGFDYARYGGSVGDFVVASGATGSAVTPFDSLACHALWRVRITNCTGIPANTRLRFLAGWDEADTMCDVYRADGAGILETNVLPTSGTFGIALPDLAGVRRVRAVFTNALTGNVTLTFMALDSAKERG